MQNKSKTPRFPCVPQHGSRGLPARGPPELESPVKKIKAPSNFEKDFAFWIWQKNWHRKLGKFLESQNLRILKKIKKARRRKNYQASEPLASLMGGGPKAVRKNPKNKMPSQLRHKKMHSTPSGLDTQELFSTSDQKNEKKMLI